MIFAKFLVFTLFLNTILFAQSASYREYIEGDPYNKPQFFASGPLKGQAISNYAYYPILWLNAPHSDEREDQEKTYQQTRKFKVANIWHDKKLWEGELDLDNISDLILQVVWMHPTIPVAHAQIRLVFKNSMKVSAQNQKYRTEKSFIKGLVFSVEAIGKDGVPYSFISGTSDQFALAYRARSIEEVHQEIIVKVDQKVEQAVLNLTPKERDEYIKTYLKRSHQLKLSQIYHTLNRNCISEQAIIIEQVAKRHYRKNQTLLSAQGIVNPVLSLQYMKRYNYLERMFLDFRIDPSIKGGPVPDLTEVPEDFLEFTINIQNQLELKTTLEHPLLGCQLSFWLKEQTGFQSFQPSKKWILENINLPASHENPRVIPLHQYLDPAIDRSKKIISHCLKTHF